MIDSREASRNLALLRSKKMPAITGKSLFLSRSQVDDDPSVVLQNTNSLLSIVGISAKKVTSIGELTRVASSMFVAIFESLFHVRMDHIIRNPQTREEVQILSPSISILYSSSLTFFLSDHLHWHAISY